MSSFCDAWKRWRPTPHGLAHSLLTLSVMALKDNGTSNHPTRSLNHAGQAVQDVQYRSSGIIFDIKPNVRDAVVDLNVKQQISDFVTTTTGVNSSPTLNKREVETTLSLQDGDVVVIGGLTQDKRSDSHSGLFFLPAFMQSKGSENSKSEILLVLQLYKL